MKAIYLFIFGIVLSIIALLIPTPTTDTNWVLFILIFSFIIVCKTIFDFLNGKRYIYFLIYIPIVILYFYFANYLGEKFHLINYQGHFKVIASAERMGYGKRGYSVEYYFDDGENFSSGFQYVDEYYYNHLKGIQIVIIERNKASEIIEWNPTSFDIIKYSKPVYYRDDEEVGNDYFYYAKLRPDLALKNFGLKKVFMGLDKNDSLLVYKNINDSIEFNTVHICTDTLQTASNRAIVGDSFAFLFHDGIYSKEQVFDEIPQAKEYYLKYCKDEDTLSGNILRNH